MITEFEVIISVYLIGGIISIIFLYYFYLIISEIRLNQLSP